MSRVETNFVDTKVGAMLNPLVFAEPVTSPLAEPLTQPTDVAELSNTKLSMLL